MFQLFAELHSVEGPGWLQVRTSSRNYLVNFVRFFFFISEAYEVKYLRHL